MAKRFKLKFTIPSFQMCRSKDLSSFPGNPIVPAIYRLSPVNPKARDTGYPSTPERTCNNKVSSKSKLLGHGCQMCRDHEDDKRVKFRARKSTSSVPSRRSTDHVAIRNKLNCHLDEEEESVSLISCMTSFSDDEADRYSNKPEKKLVTKHRRKISSSSVKKVQLQRVRFHTNSEDRRELLPESSTSTERVKKTTVVSSSSSKTRSAVEGKVRESFAVVKKSKDPYQDFKKSMVEMIREMEMSEAEDLEQLLQCFLALNSRSYHEVIVRAFMEIWQQMFAWKPASTSNNLQTGVTTTDLE